jgi:hypothetical protein
MSAAGSGTNGFGPVLVVPVSENGFGSVVLVVLGLYARYADD